LFGGGTTGGTINIITKAPTPNQTSGSVFAGYGSYASADVRAGANYAGERLGLALNAGHQESDNYRQNNRLRRTAWLATYATGMGKRMAGLKFGADLQSLQLPVCATRSNMRTIRGAHRRRETGRSARRIWHAIPWSTTRPARFGTDLGIATTIRRPTSRRP